MPSRESFRDPAGVVVQDEARVLRYLTAAGAATIAEIERAPRCQELLASQHLLSWRMLPPDEAAGLSDRLRPSRADGWCAVLEHPRVWFPSVPLEWPYPLLHAAAVLTLRVADEVLDDGFVLKDASPHNIQFLGPSPVLVDVLSIERRQPDLAAWLAYGQFLRAFLLPLTLATAGMSLSRFYGAPGEGIDGREASRLPLGLVTRLSWRWQRLVALPSLLTRLAEGRFDVRAPRLPADVALRAVRGQIRTARRDLVALAPRKTRSEWTRYRTLGPHAPEYDREREHVVEEWLGRIRPKRVLDVGANDGHYSRLAARMGASVVAIDADAAVASTLASTCAETGEDVLSLVVDVLDPTPARGWRNGEYASFRERSVGRFDCVMSLAVMHHLAARGGIPVVEIAAELARMSRGHLIFEAVPASDGMFQAITFERRSLFEHLTLDAIRDRVRSVGRVEVERPLANGRSLFLISVA